MYFLALAADYDGTIAHDGVVANQTIGALKEFKESGHRLILVPPGNRTRRLFFEVIHDLGLELNIISNKGAVMVLPPRINKAAGLEAALAQLRAVPLQCCRRGRRGKRPCLPAIMRMRGCGCKRIADGGSLSRHRPVGGTWRRRDRVAE